MLSQLWKDALKHYFGKAIPPSGIRKTASDPAALTRALKTLAGNRNFRIVLTKELLRDSEAAVQALGLGNQT